MAIVHCGNEPGTARGSGPNTICASWSSTKLMPIVASKGAMRAAPCSGRRPIRSIAMPSSAQPPTVANNATGSGRPRRARQNQPIKPPTMYTEPCAKLIRCETPKISASPTASSA
jgi:hypothetical protein